MSVKTLPQREKKHSFTTEIIGGGKYTCFNNDATMPNWLLVNQKNRKRRQECHWERDKERKKERLKWRQIKEKKRKCACAVSHLWEKGRAGWSNGCVPARVTEHLSFRPVRLFSPTQTHSHPSLSVSGKMKHIAFPPPPPLLTRWNT